MSEDTPLDERRLAELTYCFSAKIDGGFLIVEFASDSKCGIKMPIGDEIMCAINDVIGARRQFEICRAFDVKWPLGEWSSDANMRRYSTSGRSREAAIRKQFHER